MRRGAPRCAIDVLTFLLRSHGRPPMNIDHPPSLGGDRSRKRSPPFFLAARARARRSPSRRGRGGFQRHMREEEWALDSLR